MTNILEILKKDSFSPEELAELIEAKSPEEIKPLFAKANEVRRQYKTDEIRSAGLIDISNYCKEECRYCNLGNHYKDITRYRMNADEIISLGKQISYNGIKTIILQSGTDEFYDSDMISYIIFSIKKKTNIEIILDLGLRNKDEYKTWKLAGADKYIIRHQTASREISDAAESRKDFHHQIHQSEILREIDMKIGVSTIIGLPGHNAEDYVKKLLFMDEIKSSLAILTPFIPLKQTPLENNSPGSRLRTLRTIAITRILLKNIDIPALPMSYVTGEHKNERGFNVGSNLLITDFTPVKYKFTDHFGQCKQFSKHYTKIHGLRALNSEMST